MPVFASLPNILAAPPHAPVAVNGVAELCVETCVNAFGSNTLLAEKPNDDSLVALHPLNENRKRTDLARIIREVLLM
jgi:hypothetical protein